MKKLLLIISLLAAASVSYAGFLTKEVIPAFNGGKTVTLTASYPSNIDLRYDEYYSIYCAAASKERTMFGNYSRSLVAEKAAYVQSTIPATTWHTQVVNKATPYLNISGCVGQLRRP